MRHCDGENQKILEEINIIGVAVLGIPHQGGAGACSNEQKYDSLIENIHSLSEGAAFEAQDPDDLPISERWLKEVKRDYESAKKLFPLSQ